MKRTIMFRGCEIGHHDCFLWNATDAYFHGTLGGGIARTVKTDDALAIMEIYEDSDTGRLQREDNAGRHSRDGAPYFRGEGVEERVQDNRDS